jgi:hypothetical protein
MAEGYLHLNREQLRNLPRRECSSSDFCIALPLDFCVDDAIVQIAMQPSKVKAIGASAGLTPVAESKA